MNDYSGELGQLVQVGPARGGITIDHQCEWESAREGAICCQFLVRGGLQPVFDFPSRCLVYREGSIDFHGVDWRPIKGRCHLAEFGEAVPNFLCALQPAIRSYFEQFGSEQASKTTVFRHNISNRESALYVFGPILGRYTYLIIWQTTGVRSDHQVSKVRQTTFSLAKYRCTQEPRHSQSWRNQV